MTLKEKLFNIVFDNAWTYKHENTIPQLEKIADDYAIEFAEWLMDGHVSELTLKEFKKQKGYESIV